MIHMDKLKLEDGERLRELFLQLTQDVAGYDINKILGDKNCRTAVAKDSGSLIGFGALIIHLVPSKGYVGNIQDVIVRKEYRGRGIGNMIMDCLINIAKDEQLKFINLTSNPARVAARCLYEKKGFKPRDTELFSLELLNSNY